MEFTEAEVQEFKTEAYDLLDAAEQSLMALDKGAALADHYNSVFRAFHSIKGAAGMMDMTALQAHMHQLENLLVEQKSAGQLSKGLLDLFLRGVDGCRSMLDGNVIQFDYNVKTASPSPVPPVAEVVELPKKTIGKILVVDDEPDLVEFLCEILTNHNFETLGSSKAEEAIDLIKSFRPDTVLTDVAMPKLSGIELLAAIKKINPDLPVTFISAHLTRESLFQAIELGVYSVIEKPFNAIRVLDCCHSSVRKYQLTELLNKSMNLLMYQFSDLAEYLTAKGKDDIRETLSREITEIMHQRRLLRSLTQAVTPPAADKAS